MFTVFVAGTFDWIHKGHTALLSKAFASGKTVTIGLTSDEFVKKYKNVTSDKRHVTSKTKKAPVFNSAYHVSRITYHPIKAYGQRRKSLEDWLTKNNFIDRATIIPIDDPYEPAASEQALEALVVSTETRKRGEEINRKRQERGLQKLILLEVPMVAAEDQKTLSSSRVRNGEVDREGRLTMPDNLRPELQKPLGRLLVGDEISKVIALSKNTFVITVGDVTTKTFLDNGRVPDFMIIDNRVGRAPYGELKELLGKFHFHVQSGKSGPGYISHSATLTISKFLKPTKYKLERVFSGLSGNILIVDGEEDLLALPAIAQAPLGSFVYYGQPDKGLVEVEVTKEKKQHVRTFLSKFLQS